MAKHLTFTHFDAYQPPQRTSAGRNLSTFICLVIFLSCWWV